MASVTPRAGNAGARRPHDARGSVLAAAERLFYAEGIGAVGVDAIAEAAGVTKRTLYYHFASKDDLVAAYLEARDEATQRALREASDGATKAGDRVVAVFRFVERWSATAEYHGCPFNNAVAEQTVSPKVTAIARRHKATMKSWFALQAAEGGARDADALGVQLLVLLDGALNGAAVSGSPEAATAARLLAEAALDAAGVERTRAAKARSKAKKRAAGRS